MTIDLTNDEALVLFEFLARFEETDSLKINHKSEEIVLWNLTCQLEKELAEPFSSKYDKLLETAQSNVAAPYNS
jgi:hypothetical protein